MTNDKLNTIGLPFKISDLPEGVRMDSDGLHINPYVKGTVVLRLEGRPSESEFTLKIFAGKYSHVKIVLFQNLDSKADLQMQTITQAGESARIDLLQFHLGGASVNGSIIQNADEQSEINTDLLCRAEGRQKYRFEVKNVYPKKNGRGKILAKGTALDSSQISMNGGIKITRKGGGTDTHLKQDCLLLSRNANIKSTPALQIDTNDVQAGHSASVTNLNDESLFYLTSRGVDEKSARKMLMEGFMAEQLDKINDLPELKKEVQSLI